MEDQAYFHPSLQRSSMSIAHVGFRSPAPVERYVIDEIN